MSDNRNEISEADGASDLVSEVKSELADIDSADLQVHSKRFEALHEKLSGALNAIDGL